MPTIRAPSGFSFYAIIYSHGWYQLPPYRYDESARWLYRVQQLVDGTLVPLRMTDAIHASGHEVVYFDVMDDIVLSPDQTNELERIIRRILTLDWDIDPFYDALKGHPDYAWIPAARAGRMLIAPTVWEDLAKTLLTTNTTWAQTRGMCNRLCELGLPYTANDTNVHFAFPTPQQIASYTPEQLDEHIRAGYRSAYLHTLAMQIADGELDVEAWHRPDIDSVTLYNNVKSLRGFGDYAAGTMLRLLGHFDRIAIDSEARAAYRRIAGRDAVTDKDIQTYYARFGAWCGLVMWMDIIRPDVTDNSS